MCIIWLIPEAIPAMRFFQSLTLNFNIAENNRINSKYLPDLNLFKTFITPQRDQFFRKILCNKNTCPD